MNDYDSIMNVKTEEIQEDGKDTFHFHRYEPTPYPVLETIMEALQVQSEDAILDYGCGLGRLLFYANYHYRCNCIGVEFSPEFHERAMRNLTTFNGENKDKIQILCARAENYTLSPHINYIYCFNPFSTAIFRGVLNKIEESFELFPRKITLVLYYPEDETIFYIEQHTRFTRVDEIAASEDIRKDRRERFVIYVLEDVFDEEL